MYTLGIETSCDETSCAILEKRKVLSNITISSLKEHKKYGGVVPEIATRAHLKNIDKVLELSQRKAGILLKKIDLISVTYKPGLFGALVVGLNFAKALSLAINRPFVGVNHLHAHLFAPFLNQKRRIKFPFLGLVVSGGHTGIYRVDDFDKIKILGQTRDDACGEVFDKVAKAYGLGYPGGPIIDRLFKLKYKNDFRFKCGRIGFDFSFSGIKTALIYKKMEMEKKGTFGLKVRQRLVSSFQYAALETIIAIVLDAKNKLKIKSVVCGGGVIANEYLRKRLKEEKSKGIDLFIAPKEYSGDNAAMVAGLGFYLYNKGYQNSNIGLKAEAN
ncbi:MAG: tRNA (adenosine(37)-N6)-threonylcarbamoyltransferase complex transferase subunit TsaD [Omnitrophica bacterium]|nr:tRNA (adenosine(37)-N6)-threonylcarbamoyltransferase complex transferase subunit TsaD [Candidatus Omnitrophota bacterium]